MRLLADQRDGAVETLAAQRFRHLQSGLRRADDDEGMAHVFLETGVRGAG